MMRLERSRNVVASPITKLRIYIRQNHFVNGKDMVEVQHIFEAGSFRAEDVKSFVILVGRSGSREYIFYSLKCFQF